MQGREEMIILMSREIVSTFCSALFEAIIESNRLLM